jgi:hypothetical protein
MARTGRPRGRPPGRKTATISVSFPLRTYDAIVRRSAEPRRPLSYVVQDLVVAGMRALEWPEADVIEGKGKT